MQCRSIKLVSEEVYYKIPALMNLDEQKRKTIDDALQERANIIRITLEKASAKKSSLTKQEIENLNKILLHAVIRGDHETVTQILKLGVANVDTKDASGNTLLIIAMTHKQFDIAKLLIAQKANVNAKLSHPILDSGMSRNVTHCQDATPLIIAAELESPTMVSLLLDYGADINAKDCGGFTALYSAAANCPESPASLEIMALLLDKKRRPRASLELRRICPTTGSPLTVAVERKNIESIKLLVKAGADTSLVESLRRYSGRMPDPAICRLIAQLKKERSMGARFKSKMAKVTRTRPFYFSML